MKKQIMLNENQLRSIVRKSIKNIISESVDEWRSIMKFPSGFVAKKGEDWKKARIDKEAQNNPNLDPAGFSWVGDELRHNEKPRPKSAAKPKAKIISKPEGMDDAQYEKELVIPNNQKYREKLEQYSDEEFRPIVNGGRYFGGEADYGCDYEVSNRARLKVLNHSNVMKSMIYDPYPAPGKKAMQFTMKAYDDEGASMRTTPSVAYMVANAFLGEHDPSQYIVIHKDGDWTNNNVENLQWEKSNKVGKFKKKPTDDNQLEKIVSESIKKVLKEGINDSFTLTSELQNIYNLLSESETDKAMIYLTTLINWCKEHNVDNILSTEEEDYDDYFLRNNPDYYPD